MSLRILDRTKPADKRVIQKHAETPVLYVICKHHATVRRQVVRVVDRSGWILVCNNLVVHIIHRISSKVISLSLDCILEVVQLIEDIVDSAFI